MKITVDTNVLVRALVCDDPAQAQAAGKILSEATLIAVSLSCLCELTWVLRKVYAFQAADIVLAIRALMAATNVEMDRPAVEVGLVMLESGGDFADGVIAQEGRQLGGEIFASFDKRAVALLASKGHLAQLL